MSDYDLTDFEGSNGNANVYTIENRNTVDNKNNVNNLNVNNDMDIPDDSNNKNVNKNAGGAIHQDDMNVVTICEAITPLAPQTKYDNTSINANMNAAMYEGATSSTLQTKFCLQISKDFQE